MKTLFCFKLNSNESIVLFQIKFEWRLCFVSKWLVMKAVFCFKLTFCFMLKLGKEPADVKSVKECSNYI